MIIVQRIKVDIGICLLEYYEEDTLFIIENEYNVSFKKLYE